MVPSVRWSAVDFARIKGAFLHRIEGRGVPGGDSAIEAGAASGVAGSATLLSDVEDDGGDFEDSDDGWTSDTECQ